MKKRNLVAVVAVAVVIVAGVANWPLCYLLSRPPGNGWLEKPEIWMIGLLPFLTIFLLLIIVWCMIYRMCKNEEVLLDKEKAKIAEEYKQKQIFEQYQYDLYREQRNEKQLQDNRKWMFEKLNATRQELYKQINKTLESVKDKSGTKVDPPGGNASSPSANTSTPMSCTEVYPPVNDALQRFMIELDDTRPQEEWLIRQLTNNTENNDPTNK